MHLQMLKCKCEWLPLKLRPLSLLNHEWFIAIHLLRLDSRPVRLLDVGAWYWISDPLALLSPPPDRWFPRWVAESPYRSLSPPTGYWVPLQVAESHYGLLSPPTDWVPIRVAESPTGLLSPSRRYIPLQVAESQSMSLSPTPGWKVPHSCVLVVHPSIFSIWPSLFTFVHPSKCEKFLLSTITFKVFAPESPATSHNEDHEKFFPKRTRLLCF